MQGRGDGTRCHTLDGPPESSWQIVPDLTGLTQRSERRTRRAGRCSTQVRAHLPRYWSEADILVMTRPKRKLYLDLLIETATIGGGG
jgi:hypothetical protein